MLCFQLFLMTRLNQTDFVGTLYFQRISVIQLYNGTEKRQSRLSVKSGMWRVGRKQSDQSFALEVVVPITSSVSVYTKVWHTI